MKGKGIDKSRETFQVFTLTLTLSRRGRGGVLDFLRDHQKAYLKFISDFDSRNSDLRRKDGSHPEAKRNSGLHPDLYGKRGVSAHGAGDRRAFPD
jgi:hypothetical protein